MHFPLRLVLATAVFLVACSSAPVADRALSFESTTINGRVDPLGIAAEAISFAWATAATAQTRGRTQSAYRIRVGTTEGGTDVWDSGRIKSDRQVDIRLPADLQLR